MKWYINVALALIAWAVVVGAAAALAWAVIR